MATSLCSGQCHVYMLMLLQLLLLLLLRKRETVANAPEATLPCGNGVRGHTMMSDKWDPAMHEKLSPKRGMGWVGDTKWGGNGVHTTCAMPNKSLTLYHIGHQHRVCYPAVLCTLANQPTNLEAPNRRQHTTKKAAPCKRRGVRI